MRGLKLVKPVVALVLGVWAFVGSWFVSRGVSRSFTVVASEVTFPRALGPFDNTAKIRSIAGTLADSGTLSPCPPVNEVPSSGTPVPSRPCALEAIGEAKRFVLTGHGNEPRFQSLRLTSPALAKASEPCGMSLRAGAVAKESLLLAWLSERKACSPEATVLLRECTECVLVEGLGVRSKPLAAVGDPKRIATLQLPLELEQPATLEYAASLGRVELLDFPPTAARSRRGEPLTSISFVPAVPIRFTHKVGYSSVWDASCDAAPGGRVHVEADPASPISLQRVELTESGLVVSFGLERAWVLDTGTCTLSNRASERNAFVLTLLAALVAFGVFKRILDWLW